MTPIDALLIAAAGVAAGAINTIVGSGSLVTFPTLLLLGFPPLVANVSNTVGLVPGSLSGVIGYRRELVGQRRRILRLGLAALPGGVLGALLLVALPATTFERVVPYLILLASVLMALQPRLSALVARHRPHGAEHSRILAVLIFLTAIYGGYFGAAQSVIFIALLAVFVPDNLQNLNGLKNVLALIVNAVAAVAFILIAPVDWRVAVLIGVGSIVGGQLGAVVGRRMSPLVFRFAVVAVGLL
ncbi:MAG: sulfite exporter TauE/SafE family protein, partial [Chloroflexi bacterium]|nr:sulfite exporter TauE/SafE family protein [Chloroflexota bacterium]